MKTRLNEERIWGDSSGQSNNSRTSRASQILKEWSKEHAKINDGSVSGAVIPLKDISPGIDNADWSYAQSKAAWREYEKDRNIEEHPFR